MIYTPKSDFLHILVSRGFVQDCTDMQGLDEALLKGVVPGYVGYDCTGASLHVGHLVNIMLLRWLQKTGHKPVTLMGGGTTRIGDPSGKDEARQLLTDEKIAENMAGIRTVFSRFLAYGDGPTDAIMPNNADWLGALNYVRVIEDVPSARYLVTYVNRAVSTGTVAPYYRSLIVTQADSGIETLADLKGKRFAFTDLESTSGYAYPNHLLRTHGIDPDRDLAKVFFLKRHDRIIDALLHGSVDAGALADEVYFGARKRYGDKLRVVAESDPIPMVAIASSGHLDAETTARLEQAFVAMPADHPFCLHLSKVFGWHAAGVQKHSDALSDSVRAVYGRR